MNQLFISDLHLSADQPEITGLFLKFLGSVARDAKALYILGDLFDAWVGDDALDDCAQSVIAGLEALNNQGCHLFIQHGNRDFLLGDAFARNCNARLLGEAEVIEVAGHRALLMHGDLLCTDDLDYQKARRMLRNPVFIADFLSKSIPERLALAKNYRAQSHAATFDKKAEIMDVNQASVLEYLDRHQTDILIHGHTHRPGMSPVKGRGLRYCLGDWSPAGAQYLIADQHQGLQLKGFAA